MNACMKISKIIQILIALLYIQKIVQKTMIPTPCVCLHCSICSSHFVFESESWKYWKTSKHCKLLLLSWNLWKNWFALNLNPSLLPVCRFKEISQKIVLNIFCVRAFWYKCHVASIYFHYHCNEPKQRG